MSRLASAQQPSPPRANVANWALAERFSTEALRPLTFSEEVNPNWIAQSDSFWYTWRDRQGLRYMLVAPRTKTKRPLFDHKKLAAALAAVGRSFDPTDLTLDSLEFTRDRKALQFNVDGGCHRWNLAAETLGACQNSARQRDRHEQPEKTGNHQNSVIQMSEARSFSPDSTRFVFQRDYNLFLVTVATGDTMQLTRDGEPSYNVNGLAAWSSDSKGLLVHRSDTRSVKEMYVVNALSEPRPSLVADKMALPGDTGVSHEEFYLWKVGDTALTRLANKWKDETISWSSLSPSGDKVRLIRRDRPWQNLELIEVSLTTGTVRTLITESIQDGSLEGVDLRYVTETGDLIWWSERSGWAHFYLYDHEGTFKNAITSGPWRAASLVAVDTLKRVAYIAGMGREAGENPYYRHLYRVNLDGTKLTLLDSGNATHWTTLSPSRRYAIDTYSRVDLPPRSVLRDAQGRVVLELETMDVSLLTERGWKPPEPFRVKAADGVTDIFGNIFKPFDFDSMKRYPIIADVYPGPTGENVDYSFSVSYQPQQLAQLGFIVIQLGNRGGSPSRSSAYHNYGYHNLRDYGLADKKVGIEQLAARYPWIDLNRVGIYGFSGGGFMTATALLLPPYNEFFKVGVSISGNHDNNIFKQDWAERYHGLREVVGKPQPDGSAGLGAVPPGRVVPVNDSVYYEIQVPTNIELAANLKGNLLLMHGDMDNWVHPAHTLRLVNALMRANKRFDFMMFPGEGHGFGAEKRPYSRQMLSEYFAEHLLGDYYRGNADMPCTIWCKDGKAGN